MRKCIPWVVLCLVILSGGCGSKLKLASSFAVPVQGKVFEIDAIRREQTVKVSATASGAPISVYVYLKKNATAAEKEILGKKFTETIIAKQEKSEQITLEARIPANEIAVVTVHRASSQSANVQLDLSN